MRLSATSVGGNEPYSRYGAFSAMRWLRRAADADATVAIRASIRSSKSMPILRAPTAEQRNQDDRSRYLDRQHCIAAMLPPPAVGGVTSLELDVAIDDAVQGHATTHRLRATRDSIASGVEIGLPEMPSMAGFSASDSDGARAMMTAISVRQHQDADLLEFLAERQRPERQAQIRRLAFVKGIVGSISRAGFRHSMILSNDSAVRS